VISGPDPGTTPTDGAPMPPGLENTGTSPPPPGAQTTTEPGEAPAPPPGTTDPPGNQSPVGHPVDGVPQSQQEDLLPTPGAVASTPATPSVPEPSAPANGDGAPATLASDGMPAQPGEVTEVAAYPVEEETWGSGDEQRPERPEPPDDPGPVHRHETAPAPASAEAPDAVAAAPPDVGAHEPEHHEHHHHHHHHHHERGGDDHAPVTGIVEVDAADLEATAQHLRRWSAELQSVAAGLGTVRAGMGMSSVQPLVDEVVGRQAVELELLASELLDEAAELGMRAQLAHDELDVAAPVAPPPAPAATSGPGALVEEILDVLDGDDDKHAS
jgi:hypothetical protein